VVLISRGFFRELGLIKQGSEAEKRKGWSGKQGLGRFGEGISTPTRI